MKPTISAVVITYNNEDCIGHLIKSILWMDEIVVVDSGSTDRTIEAILELAPAARIFTRKFDDFSSQRNYGIDQATCDWLMHFDSDEEVPTKSAEVIQEAIRKWPDKAFNSIRLNYWRQDPVPFWDGPYGSRVRVHPRGKGRFTGKIHEYVETPLEVRMIDAPIKHVSWDTAEERFTKLVTYAQADAAAVLRGERKFRKLSEFSVLWSSMRTFLYWYLLRGGYRSGFAGLFWILQQVIYRIFIFTYIWEKKTTAR